MTNPIVIPDWLREIGEPPSLTLMDRLSHLSNDELIEEFRIVVDAIASINLLSKIMKERPDFVSELPVVFGEGDEGQIRASLKCSNELFKDSLKSIYKAMRERMSGAAVAKS